MLTCVAGLRNQGAPDVAWGPVQASQTIASGDVIGQLTTGYLERLGSAAITSGGGIYGFAANSDTSDASGNLISPSVPSGIDPGVPAIFAIPSYGRRVTPASPISGVKHGQIQVYLATNNNYFIQRHKLGTRINNSVCGKICNLTWNSTTLEWEVDTTATNVGDIVIAPANLQLPLWRDNFSLWDSASFATDALAPWVVFQVVPAFQASNLGLRY